MRITLSKGAVIWGISLLIGFILLSEGVLSGVKYLNAVDFDGLEAAKCRKGKYVSGDIDSFLKIPIQTIGGVSYSGVSVTYNTLWETYDIYTVPIKNDKYICIMVADSGTKELLSNAAMSESEAIHFEGKIIKTSILLNEEWYDELSGFEIDSVVAGVAVKQTTYKSITNLIYGGLAILICCAAAWFTGKLKGAVIKEEVG